MTLIFKCYLTQKRQGD